MDALSFYLILLILGIFLGAWLVGSLIRPLIHAPYYPVNGAAPVYSRDRSGSVIFLITLLIIGGLIGWSALSEKAQGNAPFHSEQQDLLPLPEYSAPDTLAPSVRREAPAPGEQQASVLPAPRHFYTDTLYARSPSAEPRQPIQEEGDWYLQLAAFSDPGNAQIYKESLENRVRYPVHLSYSSWPEQLYKVLIGPFSSRKEAVFRGKRSGLGGFPTRSW